MKNLPTVAYFCMEYGLESHIKTYAGGLGILAGDYMKGANDGEYPIIGIGIKWKQGYTEQMIDENGRQFDCYKSYDYDCLEDTGIKVSVKIRESKIQCKVWKVVKYGVHNLYLLDTDLDKNPDRWITGQLYGWFGEERIAQEMVLGIAGVRALRALGHNIDIYHFNEGHAVLAGIELIREEMSNGLSFSDAKAAVKKKIVFTTHTPIIQGNESHPLKRLKYMGAFNGLKQSEMKEIGGSPFNMTVAALRLSKISNAVAQLHKDTAVEMWKDVPDCSNIIGITNAIHLPTWVDNNMIEAAKSGNNIWETHQGNKRKLLEFIKERTNVTLDENKLLIGFSRRAVRYKRSNLIFTNKSKINELFKNNDLQIVFSGKAHPLDEDGKSIVQEIVQYSKLYPNSVVFLPDYDMNIGRALTRGVDVWLNNPRRPQEASGTSGMKAAMNGVLNASILDGWWPEAVKHNVNGWEFGQGKSIADFRNLKELDAHDTREFYEILFQEIIPTYYKNNPKWVAMMKESILSTKDFFDVQRMLKEYYERMYCF